MIKLNERGVENLCNGVVYQAVKDYRNALVDSHKHPFDNEAQGRVKNLEQFFKSDLFRFWQPNLDGIKLMESVRDEVIEYNYDLKALNKSHHPNGSEEEAC